MLLPAVFALGGAESGASAAEEGARADPAVCGLGSPMADPGVLSGPDEVAIGSPIADPGVLSGPDDVAVDAADALSVPGGLEVEAEAEPGAFRIGDVVLVDKWMMSLPLTARLSFDFFKSLVSVSVRAHFDQPVIWLHPMRTDRHRLVQSQ